MREDKARKWTAKRAAKKSGAEGPQGPQGSKSGERNRAKSYKTGMNRLYEAARLQYAKNMQPDAMFGYQSGYRPDDLMNGVNTIRGYRDPVTGYPPNPLHNAYELIDPNGPSDNSGMLQKPVSYQEAEKRRMLSTMIPDWQRDTDGQGNYAGTWGEHNDPYYQMMHIQEAQRRYEAEQRFLQR